MKKILIAIILALLAWGLYDRYHIEQPVAYGHVSEEYTFSDGYTTYIKQTCLFLDNSTQILEYFQFDGPIKEKVCIK